MRMKLLLPTSPDLLEENRAPGMPMELRANGLPKEALPVLPSARRLERLRCLQNRAECAGEVAREDETCWR